MSRPVESDAITRASPFVRIPLSFQTAGFAKRPKRGAVLDSSVWWLLVTRRKTVVA
jgi:hypothetical protein